MNWLNISAVVEDEGMTNWVRAVGFTSPTTLLISVPPDVTFSNNGTLTVISSVDANFLNLKRSFTVQVASIGTSVTQFPIDPGDYVLFSAFCEVPAGPFTVTVTNKPNGATIDTFQVQVEV